MSYDGLSMSKSLIFTSRCSDTKVQREAGSSAHTDTDYGVLEKEITGGLAHHLSGLHSAAHSMLPRRAGILQLLTCKYHSSIRVLRSMVRSGENAGLDRFCSRTGRRAVPVPVVFLFQTVAWPDVGLPWRLKGDSSKSMGSRGCTGLL